jgi:hypothetical protein
VLTHLKSHFLEYNYRSLWYHKKRESFRYLLDAMLAARLSQCTVWGVDEGAKAKQLIHLQSPEKKFQNRPLNKAAKNRQS